MLLNLTFLCTGCGEHLVKTLFAKELASTILSTQTLSEATSQAFQEHFLGKKQTVTFTKVLC